MPEDIRLSKRFIRLSPSPISGFVKVLQLLGKDTKDELIRIAKDSDPKQMIVDISNTTIRRSRLGSIVDTDIDEYIQRKYDPTVIEGILCLAESVAMEEDEVSSERMIETTRSILQDIGIQPKKPILTDFFYSIALYESESDELISHMYCDFTWDNMAGDKAFECLINRKKFKGDLIFCYMSRDDKVIINMNPENNVSPVYKEGLDESKDAVKDFISRFRENITWHKGDKDVQNTDSGIELHATTETEKQSTEHN